MDSLADYLFTAGRDFRTFKEFYNAEGTGIPEGSTYVIRVVVPINILFTGLSITLDNGFLRTRTYSGGTAGGTFSQTLPALPRNTMTDRPTPIYSPQVSITAGGTYDLDGQILDVLRVKVENATGAAATVGGTQDSERGVGPGTYYFVLSNIGTGPAEGVFRARWIERA